ncbi:MAG: hypothetical protein ACTHMJ_23570, partial [Thermomicrobiales bacterium]
WSDRTLLARQLRHLRQLEAADGVQRVFTVPWERVAADVPAYGDRVRARIAQFGRDHPFICTEYDLQELAGGGSLFNLARRAQLQGDHPRQRRPTPGRAYALLLEVAGEDEAGGLLASPTGRRDSTALTVVEVGSRAHPPTPPPPAPPGPPAGPTIVWLTAASGPAPATPTCTRRWWTWHATTGAPAPSSLTPPASGRG